MNPLKYTEERFMHGIGDALMKEQLNAALASGYQIKTSLLDYQAVPAVLILACYGRNYLDSEIVDDYPALVQAHREAISVCGQCAHPDLYLASCIVILHDREQYPSIEAFEDVNVPELFAQMVNAETLGD